MRLLPLAFSAFLALGIVGHAAAFGRLSSRQAQEPLDSVLEKLQEMIEDSGSFDAKSDTAAAHFSAKVLQLDRNGLSVRTTITSVEGNSRFTSTVESGLSWSGFNGILIEKSDLYDPAFTVSLRLKTPMRLVTSETTAMGMEKGDEQKFAVDVFFGKRADADHFRDQVLALAARMKLNLDEPLTPEKLPPSLPPLAELENTLKSKLEATQTVKSKISDSEMTMVSTVQVKKLDNTGFAYSQHASMTMEGISPSEMDRTYEIAWSDISSVRTMEMNGQVLSGYELIIRLNHPIDFQNKPFNVAGTEIPEKATDRLEILFANEADVNAARDALSGILLRLQASGSG